MSKHKFKPLAISLANLLCANLAIAQESVNTTGGSATGVDGNVAYSIGQVFYTTNTASGGSVSNGVQHAYEIFVLGLENTELSISLTAFPNPIAENLTLETSIGQNLKLAYQLLDIQGKPMDNGKVTAFQTQIPTNSLPNGIYFLNVLNQENKKVKSFKIIKN